MAEPIVASQLENSSPQQRPSFTSEQVQSLIESGTQLFEFTRRIAVQFEQRAKAALYAWDQALIDISLSDNGDCGDYKNDPSL